MNNYLLNMTRRVFMVVMFLFCTAAGWAQSYQNGMRKGQIKVKFASSMTATLGRMKVSARSSGFTTGIQLLDVAAKKASATNMYRLFPANSKNENKLHKHGLDLWYVVEIKDNMDPKMAVAQFKQLQEVALAEPEFEKVLVPFTVTPYVPGVEPAVVLPFNDPLLKDQWHYNNIGQSGFGDADVNLFEAWKKTAGANDIIISEHDQGVDVNHVDLKNNIWVNQEELTGTPNVDDDNNGYVDDINGYNFQKDKGAVDPEFHGTHVAGTMAAVNNNGIGVAGVAGGTGNGDGVKIMSLQIFGGLFENSYIYAADNGAVISQNSWGYSNPYSYDQSVKDAIDYFIAEAGNYPGSPMKGGLVIFAAGNSNSDSEWYPGYFPNVMAVASIGPEWEKAGYSNFGTWVEISATGGDQQAYNSKSGVLSTVPKNQYAYLQGTSMACPHMSGIAALALANRTRQLTNTELWNKLVTGVVNIDEYNPDYIGKMGSGAVDAALAIKNDLGFAPAGITNLNVTGIAQEFATLGWTVPSDNDDIKPTSFQLYYSTLPITAANLNTATKVTIKNEKAVGDAYEYEVSGLLGVTTYYFSITSTDRWGNISALSNEVTETTNQGPAIVVDENSQSINLKIDVTNSSSASHDITIQNNAEGILRWNHFIRHSNAELSFNAAGINYPILNAKKSNADLHIGKLNTTVSKNQLRSNEATPSSFTEIEKTYLSYVTNIIGDMDTALTNSSATKFYVNEADGFNLTQVRAYLNHDPAKGSVIVEIYKGSTPTKDNLIFAQEHNNSGETWAYITLNEQQYFESGETFWVVVHVPSGNLYPLGMGYEAEDSYSKNCFMSFNLGESWVSLESALNEKSFVWAVSAVSENAALGAYLTLEPGSGDVDGNGETMTMLSADASTLINGSYNAKLVITSNDASQKELRIPVNVTVTGHQPDIKHVDIVDFGSVFVGTSKTLEVVLDNQGFGNFNEPTFTSNNAQFVIDDYAPWQIKAREQVVLKIKFMPTDIGNINDVLTISNGVHTYEIPLFGVGAETSKIVLSPETQVLNDITIGDEVTAQITVENNGAYPLKYFIPGFDSKGLSNNWPTSFHTYGYKVRSNKSNETNPLSYEFQDIKATGIDITSQLNTQFKYFAVDMGFDFPYYGQKMQTLYVAQKGFTTFDNTVNPINSPSLNNPYNPRGYISPLGGYFSYLTQGKIFYQVEADRVIVQYDNIWDGYSVGESITVQMVLFSNGDIRFYYDNMGFSKYNQQGLTILIEDYDQTDGILVHNYNNTTELFSGLALGFDYPGPNIITKIENGSGLVSPGSSAEVSITMTTDSLSEGIVNRYINFISNDPSNPQAAGLIQLDVKYGGITKSIVSTDTIAFGNVFQGDVKSSIFTIKNTGTANIGITSMTLVNSDFTLLGDRPTSVKPGLYKKYEIQVPTSTLASLEDWLSINYTDGTHDTIYITAKVVDAPGINIDLSLLQQTLAYGDSISIPFTIENTGLGKLEVTATGKQWLSFDAPTAADDITYTYEKHNTGGVYQWFDIRKTGTQLQFVDFEDFQNSFWRKLTLPFPVEFYGVKYDSFKIGDNGIISFEENPEASFFTNKIPTSTHPGACIMPYWTFSGFSDYEYAKEDIGIFYKYFDDKIIITWSYFVNNFGGMGDPVSAQIIFYKNGTMKFQYKAEEGGADLTSNFSSVGLQKDSANGVMISEYLALDHGAGLAYVIVPAKKLSIAANTTLVGQINIDSRNVYGGVYNETLKIQTNVPGSKNLEKPVELIVIGDALFVASTDTVDFGNKIIAFEFGSPTTKTADLKFTNEGAAPYEITWAQMADGTQGLSLQIYTLVEGWFGPEWHWVDISELYASSSWSPPTFTLMPGDELVTRATFSASTPGDFIDELVLTTSLGEQRIVLKGTAVEPAVLHVDKTPIVVMMNTTTETADKTIAFDNVDGKSDLEYAISIDYHRAAAIPSNAVVMTSGISKTKMESTKASVKKGTRTQSTYNRVISHTQSQTPDTFIGNGGSASITIATKYNAGSEGFNLSHIETWLRTEELASGKIEVVIMAGGTSIANAGVVAEGKLDFTGSGNDEVGKFYQVKMDNAARIYPNEDFYVSVTYPFGIAFPQGSITNSETIEGRYYYFDEGAWYNIQSISDFANIGWLMFAAEETGGSTSWLTITSATEGALAMGESSTTELHFDGAIAERGDQLADIVYTSNDPTAATTKVPVRLHINEGPHYTGAQKNIIMSEMDTVSIIFNVIDVEGHTYTLTPAETYKGVKHTLVDTKLTITLTPDYSDAGNHTYVFKGTDQIGAVSELTLTVEVMETNRAPVYVADEETKMLEYNSIGKLFDYSLNEFFADPDEDVVNFNVVSGNIGIADVFASTNHFMVRPIAMGETILVFTITDIHGAVLQDTINVVVNNILGLEEEASSSVKVYPNPVHQFAKIFLSYEWKGAVKLEIVDATGRQHLVQEVDATTSHDIQLNVSNLQKGFYVLRAASADKQVSVKLIKD